VCELDFSTASTHIHRHPLVPWALTPVCHIDVKGGRAERFLVEAGGDILKGLSHETETGSTVCGVDV
jgi:hypothetical protein